MAATYTYTSDGTFTVPATGIYDITAYGAAGGYGNAGQSQGGAGAEVYGSFSLVAGEVLTIDVGSAGLPGGNGIGGLGGGGSYVVATYVPGTGAVFNPEIAAGGGGGGGHNFIASLAGYNGQAPNGASFPAGNGATFTAGSAGGKYGGGAGGYSLNNASNPTLDTFGLNTASQNGLVTIVSEAVCYLRGTRILTLTGNVRVEDLRIGDAVVTRFNAIQPIKWIGKQSFDFRFVRNDRERMPVCIHAGALGRNLPARDLYVSPGHSMLIENTLVLAASLVNGLTITQDWAPETIDYFQIELDAHDCVIAEGTWGETFADGPGLREKFHNQEEFYRLYPYYKTPERLALCAARPERGEALDTVLRPIVAQAMKGVRPGPLIGYIDQVILPRRIEGWAHDVSHSEMPVLLEVLLEGRVVGTVLACDYRADLKEAGFGNGRCAFNFNAPASFKPEDFPNIRIRRAADGAYPLTIAEAAPERQRMVA